jgi:hypothetical protein
VGLVRGAVLKSSQSCGQAKAFKRPVLAHERIQALAIRDASSSSKKSAKAAKRQLSINCPQKDPGSSWARRNNSLGKSGAWAEPVKCCSKSSCQ